MLFFNRRWALVGGILLLSSCSYLDDYMLGKDNTPVPTALTSFKPKVKLVEKWSITIGKPSKASAYLKLKPVLRGKTIYVAETTGTVHAINKYSGHVLWAKQLSQGVLSGPTLAQGYLALGTTKSNVSLLSQDDGHILHEFRVSGDVLSKPVMVNNKIIVKTIDGYLYAFDLKTGEKLWATDHGAPSLILKASASPVLMGSLALVGFSDGKLDAVDIESGRVMWQRSIAYATGASDVERLVDIDADPIVRGDAVYLASYQGYIGALSLSSGQFIWRKPASVYKNLAIDDSTLYITDSEDVIWAVDRATGQVKWKQDALKARGLTEPTLLNHRLVVGDRTGFIHILSTKNGTFLARQQVSGPVEISPAISKNNIYVMTANGKLSRLSVS